ncbi:MAG: hypothetical protein H7Z37_10215 [Pyrinomonadaceae bacterium]|nr:hypothetical protein [Pyrinomonadaceae bacterium]
MKLTEQEAALQKLEKDFAEREKNQIGGGEFITNEKKYDVPFGQTSYQQRDEENQLQQNSEIARLKYKNKIRV